MCEIWILQTLSTHPVCSWPCCEEILQLVLPLIQVCHRCPLPARIGTLEIISHCYVSNNTHRNLIFIDLVTSSIYSQQVVIDSLTYEVLFITIDHPFLLLMNPILYDRLTGTSLLVDTGIIFMDHVSLNDFTCFSCRKALCAMWRYSKQFRFSSKCIWWELETQIQKHSHAHTHTHAHAH